MTEQEGTTPSFTLTGVDDPLVVEYVKCYATLIAPHSFTGPDREEHAEQYRLKVAAAREVQAEILRAHAERVSAAGALAPFLNLHSPVFYRPHDTSAACDGCDIAEWDEASSPWPCRTYRLALSLAGLPPLPKPEAEAGQQPD